MPERTTPKQRMIALVREHLAQPGVTVTESKKLFDPAAGKMREVDVVAEGDLDGDSLVVSVEVIDRGHPATLTWVEEMLGKHMTMPTNKLVLVSWSGFSRGALAKINFLPRVEAVTPTQVLGPDGTRRQSEALYVDQINLTAERVTVRLRSPAGTIGEFVHVGPDAGVFDEDGAEVGAMGEMVTSFLRSEGVGRQLAVEAHSREDRESLKWFTFAVAGLDDVVNTTTRSSHLNRTTSPHRDHR